MIDNPHVHIGPWSIREYVAEIRAEGYSKSFAIGAITSAVAYHGLNHRWLPCPSKPTDAMKGYRAMTKALDIILRPPECWHPCHQN